VITEYTTEPGLYGNLISQNRQGDEHQYHFDALGSTLALTDDTQQVTDTNAYSAFGEVTERTGSTGNPFQYVGKWGYYRDDISGASLVRRRPYSAQAGMWLSVDQDHVNGQERHAYRYCRDAPIMRIDPRGLLSLKPVHDSFSFAACGGYLVTWELVPKAPGIPAKETVVVQYVCIYSNLAFWECEYRGVPPFCRMCQYVRKLAPKPCCFWELVGDRVDKVEDVHFSPPFSDQRRSCTTVGEYRDTAYIAVYKHEDVKDELAKKFTLKSIKCNNGLRDQTVIGGPFYKGDDPPEFWKAGGRLAKELAFDAVGVRWDCCSRPYAQETILLWNDSSHDEVKSKGVWLLWPELVKGEYKFPPPRVDPESKCECTY
jgi:RHS repeat-associated protein